MLLEGERQIVGLIKPPGMQWQPLIFDTECGDFGPKLLWLVCLGLRGECHCRLLLAVDEVTIVTDVIRFDHKMPGDD
jgi:hypothetical protein